MASFVKFLRGSVAAYERLAVKDKDTLYFIYENPEDTTGSLYLGTKLICGPNGAGASVLTELSDVNISPTLLRDGMILQYNGTTNAGTWQAVSLQSAIENANVAINSSVSSGETEEGESRQDAIDRLIPDPKEGDIVLIDNFSYIYDGTEWKPLSAATNLEDRVDALELKVGSPATIDSPATGLYTTVGNLENELHNNYYTKLEVNEVIANVNHLTYRPVASLEDIDLNATTSQNVMFLVPRVGDLADDKYDEYLVIDNKLERVGKLDVDLSNYVTTDDNRLLTNDQIDKLNHLVIDDQGHAAISDCLIRGVDINTFTVSQEGTLYLSHVPANAINLNQYALKSSVGNLDNLMHHSTNLVDEINIVSDILTWHPIEEY